VLSIKKQRKKQKRKKNKKNKKTKRKKLDLYRRAALKEVDVDLFPDGGIRLAVGSVPDGVLHWATGI